MIRFLKRKKSDHPSQHSSQQFPHSSSYSGYPPSSSSSHSHSDLPTPTPVYARFARTASGTDLAAFAGGEGERKRERKRSKVLPAPPPQVPEERPSLARQISAQYATTTFVPSPLHSPMVGPVQQRRMVSPVSPPASVDEHSAGGRQAMVAPPHLVQPSPRSDSLRTFASPVSLSSSSPASARSPPLPDALSTPPPRSLLSHPSPLSMPSPPSQPVSPPTNPLTPPSSPSKRSSFIFVSGGKLSSPPTSYALPEVIKPGKRDPSPGWSLSSDGGGGSVVGGGGGEEPSWPAREPRKLRKKSSKASSAGSAASSLGLSPMTSKRSFPSAAAPSAFKIGSEGKRARSSSVSQGEQRSEPQQQQQHGRGQSVSAALSSPTYQQEPYTTSPSSYFPDPRLSTYTSTTTTTATTTPFPDSRFSSYTSTTATTTTTSPLPRPDSLVDPQWAVLPPHTPRSAGMAGIGAGGGGGSAQSTPLSGMYVGRDGFVTSGSGGSRGLGVFEAAQNAVVLDGLVPLDRSRGGRSYANGNGNGNGRENGYAVGLEQAQRSQTVDTFVRQQQNGSAARGVSKLNGVPKSVSGRAMTVPSPELARVDDAEDRSDVDVYGVPDVNLEQSSHQQLPVPVPVPRTRSPYTPPPPAWREKEAEQLHLPFASTLAPAAAPVPRTRSPQTPPPPTWREKEAEQPLSPSASSLRRSPAKRQSLSEGEGRPRRESRAAESEAGSEYGTASAGGGGSERGGSKAPSVVGRSSVGEKSRAPSVSGGRSVANSSAGSNGAASIIGDSTRAPSSLANNSAAPAVVTPPRKRHDAGAAVPAAPLIPFPKAPTPTMGNSRRPSDPRYKLPAPRSVPSVADSTASIRTSSPPPPTDEGLRGPPFVQFLLRPACLAELLVHLSYRDFASLTALSRSSRLALHDTRALREEGLERFLRTVGYRRWPRAEKRDEPLALSLRDLGAYLMGVSIGMHQYDSAAEAYLSSRDPQAGSVVRTFAGAARAYTRVVLRLRAQAESSWDADAGKGPFLSPLFRLGHAPLLRVFVPSPAGAWLSDESVVECEKELRRAGVMSLMRRGDVVWDAAMPDEGNIGRLIWDGNYLLDLEYDYSKCGQLPHYFNSLAFSPYYWHKVIRTTTNPIAHIDLRPYGREVLGNVELLQERVQVESAQGGYHTIIGYVHRTFAQITGGVSIPECKELVNRAWEGKLVIECEGTNEGLADLQARCARGGGKRVFRILRERSRPGEVWVRVVREKERAL